MRMGFPLDSLHASRRDNRRPDVDIFFGAAASTSILPITSNNIKYQSIVMRVTPPSEAATGASPTSFAVIPTDYKVQSVTVTVREPDSLKHVHLSPPSTCLDPATPVWRTNTNLPPFPCLLLHHRPTVVGARLHLCQSLFLPLVLLINDASARHRRLQIRLTLFSPCERCVWFSIVDSLPCYREERIDGWINKGRNEVGSGEIRNGEKQDDSFLCKIFALLISSVHCHQTRCPLRQPRKFLSLTPGLLRQFRQSPSANRDHR